MLSRRYTTITHSLTHSLQHLHITYYLTRPIYPPHVYFGVETMYIFIIGLIKRIIRQDVV
jgi:hypothetical protein